MQPHCLIAITPDYFKAWAVIYVSSRLYLASSDEKIIYAYKRGGAKPASGEPTLLFHSFLGCDSPLYIRLAKRGAATRGLDRSFPCSCRKPLFPIWGQPVVKEGVTGSRAAVGGGRSVVRFKYKTESRYSS